MARRIVPALLSASLVTALALVWGCGSPSEPPKPGPGAGTAKPPAGKVVPVKPEPGDEAGETVAKPAEVPVKGPAGPYPTKAIEEVREGLGKINRMQEHVVKALVKTPRTLKEKGLLADAEKTEASREVSMALMMNGWVAPDRWRDSRDRAKAALEALEALQKAGADPAPADKAELVAKAQAALKTAEVTEADLKMVHKYQQDLAEAFALKP